MKKSIALTITALFISSFAQAYFLSEPALAFDPEYTVFEPPMIYSVYEEEGGVIPSGHVILSEQHVILSDSEGSNQVSSFFLNPFDILLSIGKIQDSAFKYKNAILELKEKLWHPPKDPSVVTLKYWNSLTESQQKELHYYRNNYQGDIPKTEKEAKENDGRIPDWWCLGPSGSHNLNGATGNNDCRGIFKNLHIQAIYDKNGNLVTDPENIGTYDFGTVLPFYMHHAIIDVKPWIEWGNSPFDTTAKKERIEIMKGAFYHRWILYRLGYISIKEVFIKN